MAAELRYLLDTNISIYLLDGNSHGAANRLADQDAGSVATSSICLAELLVKLTPKQAARLPQFLANIAVLPFDDAAAIEYGRLPFERRSFDRLIAAHALSLGLTVVTANEVDFANILDLRVENWNLA